MDTCDGDQYEHHGRVVLKPIPWIKKEEFEILYTQLYSEKVVDKRWAVDRIEAWRSRDPHSVPAAVEATEAFVRATILDCIIQNNIAVCNYPDVCLMYSMALIRFVNLISDQFQKGEHLTPLKLIARKHGIPEIIIQLRNQASHSVTPEIEKVRQAAEVCLQWLEDYYWKSETANTLDYCLKLDYSGEDQCKEALLYFQKLQYESLYETKKSPGKKGKKPVKQAITAVNSLIKTNGNSLVKTLAKPEFLLSLTAYSRPLLESSDRFIEEEAVVLPKKMQSFWQPVINALHRNHLLGELILNLLESHKKLDDRDQRMAIAWVAHILNMITEFSDSPEVSNSEFYSPGKKPVLNWFQLIEASVKNYSKYTPAVLPILLECVFPPLATASKNCLAGLVAIAIGALAEMPSINKSSGDKKVYDIDNIKTVLELQDVVSRGETSFCHSENNWVDLNVDTNWNKQPMGIICGQENRVVNPKVLQYDHLSHDKDKANSETPGDPTVVPMECEDSRPLGESTEVPVDNNKVEETVEVNDDELNVGDTNADYCDPDDIGVF